MIARFKPSYNCFRFYETILRGKICLKVLLVLFIVLLMDQVYNKIKFGKFIKWKVHLLSKQYPCSCDYWTLEYGS